LIHKISNRTFIDRYSYLLRGKLNFSKSQPIVDIVLEILKETSLNIYAYKVSPSSVYLRHFLAKELEFRLEDIFETRIIRLQNLCRGYLARMHCTKIQLQNRALRCIQRNGRTYMQIKQWAWWRLFNIVKHASLNNINRENELQNENSVLSRRINVMQSEIEMLISTNQDILNTANFYKRLVIDARNGTGTISPEVNQNKYDGIESVQALLDQKDAEINDLKNQLEGLKIESPIIDKKESEKTEGTADRSMEIKHLQNCNDLQSREITELNEALSIAKRQLNDFRNIDQNHIVTVSDLKSTIEEMKISNVELQTNNLKLTKQIDQLQQELQDATLSNDQDSATTDFQVAYDRLKSQLKAAQKEIEMLEEEIDERAEQCENIEKNCLGSDLQLQQERKRHLDEINKKDEELEHFQATYQARLKCHQEKQDELENENFRLRRQLRLIESKLQDSKSVDQQMVNSDEMDALKLKLLRYKALLCDARFQLQNDNKSNEAELLIKSLKSNIKDLEEDNHSLERSKQAIKLDRDELQAQLDEINRCNARLKQEVHVLARDNKNLHEENEESERESGNIMNLLQERTSSLSTCQTELKSCRAMINNLESENARIQNQLSELESTISMNNVKTQADNKKMHECKISELEYAISVDELVKKRLQHQVERLKEHNLRSVESYKEVSDQLSMLEVQFKECQSELRQSKHDNELVKVKLKEFENTIRILEETDTMKSKDIANLRNQLKQATDRMHHLHDAAISEDIIMSRGSSKSSENGTINSVEN
ncbi:hypothetical protein GJ496_010542, partial [Pomphorhynchus laevis]